MLSIFVKSPQDICARNLGWHFLTSCFTVGMGDRLPSFMTLEALLHPDLYSKACWLCLLKSLSSSQNNTRLVTLHLLCWLLLLSMYVFQSP